MAEPSLRLAEARQRYEAARPRREAARALLDSPVYRDLREKALGRVVAILGAYKVDDVAGERAIYVVGRLRQVVDELLEPQEAIRESDVLWNEIQMLERIEGGR